MFTTGLLQNASYHRGHNSLLNILPKIGHHLWSTAKYSVDYDASCALLRFYILLILHHKWGPNEVIQHGLAWWRHQMETLSALLVLCAENSPVTGEFPHKGKWRGVLMFSLICARINVWVHNREAGDLRRHRAYYVVIVMIYCCISTP